MEEAQRMGEGERKFIKIIQGVLCTLVVGVFLFFVLGQKYLPSDHNAEAGDCKSLEASWERVLMNKQRVPQEIPGVLEDSIGRWVTLETVLPEDQKDTWMSMRSLQQEIEVYVGEELRTKYSTVEVQPFGETSTIGYVFWPIEDEDAGEVLRIRLFTKAKHQNAVSEILVGDKSDIWSEIIRVYGPGTFVAAFMLLASALVVLYGIILRVTHKKDVELTYMGAGTMLAAAWILSESRLRQFLLPNSTVAMYMGFFMIMLLPYPFLTYLNKVQNERYHKIYDVIQVTSLINFIICTTLQVFNIQDFYETMTLSHIIIILLILAMAYGMIRDTITGAVKDYKEAALGFIGLMLSGVLEVIMSYFSDVAYNGIPLCLGLVALLAAGAVKSAKDLLRGEREQRVAAAANESKAKFLANMSHEIRTPINTIVGMDEMILRESKDETIREYAYNIKKAGKMLLGLINDVLDFTKLESGKLEIVEKEYLTAELVHDVVVGMQERIKQKGLSFELEIDENIPTELKGDEIRIKQVLNNLLSNAVKYTEQGSVKLVARGGGGAKAFSLIFEVRDTGMGIREEDMGKLFDTFQRLELSKNRGIEGAGLGLSITKQLIANMEGHIDVQSTYGEGSCFTVSIPQTVIDNTPTGDFAKRYHEQIESTESAPESYFCMPEAKILVVDDNRMNLMVIRELLKRSQVQAEFASSGTECLEMTQKEHFDLIFMDHMMPEPDGVQTLHLMREQLGNLNRETPVVVLTANVFMGAKEHYQKEGFEDYLTKPVETEKMEAMMTRFLKK